MEQLRSRAPLGRCGVSVPPIIFGTSALGNLYRELPYATKREIVAAWFDSVASPVAVDSAGKYGAGLALETVGRALRDLRRSPSEVVISNKLGWKRVPLAGPEPTFEPGVWKGIDHDAVQEISYEGILTCFEQGNELLGDGYVPALVSVHDPDEFLAAAATDAQRDERLASVFDAYRALAELRGRGKAQAVGVGAKDWTVVRRIADRVDLDWVMFACSMTVYTHPPEVEAFMADLERAGVGIINSAVFNAGFLIGGSYFDYRPVQPETHAALFRWRETFYQVCRRHDVRPADACVEFGLSAPGVGSVALNTSNPRHIRANAEAVQSRAPKAFWDELKDRGIVRRDYERV
jgi:D-threo-aldose 1-dehydrogenase